MAAVTAAAVKALREKTTLPMMDCKKALVEADGDEAKAIEILREQFKKIQIKRADNETTEGLIAIAMKDDGSEGTMVEVQCESAPVASSDEFVSFTRQCANQLLNGPGAATSEELLAQPAPEVEGKTLQDVWEDLTNQIREKIVVGRIARVAGPVNGYIHHDGKNGCVFQAEGESGNLDILRDVAMHITALHPLAAPAIEHCFEFFNHEGDIAAPAEDGGYHPRQRHGPGVVLGILRIHDNLERTAAAVLHNIVDSDVHGVIGFRPVQLVGLAGQFFGTR